MKIAIYFGIIPPYADWGSGRLALHSTLPRPHSSCACDPLDAGGSATVSIAANAPCTAQTLEAVATAGTNNNINETDKSNNVAVTEIQVVRDTTPPTTTATVTLAPNAAGWNNSDVTGNLNSTDNLSGLARSVMMWRSAWPPGQEDSFCATSKHARWTVSRAHNPSSARTGWQYGNALSWLPSVRPFARSAGCCALPVGSATLSTRSSRAPVRALLGLAVQGLRFFGERGYQAMFGRDSGRAFGIGDRRRWHAATADGSVNVGWRCTAAAVHDPVGASPNVP